MDFNKILTNPIISGIIFFILLILLLLFGNSSFIINNDSNSSNYTYKLFTNGQCEEGYEIITNCNECNEQSKNLNDIDGVDCNTSDNDLFPPGCYQIGNNSGFGFNSNLDSKGTFHSVLCKKKI